MIESRFSSTSPPEGDDLDQFLHEARLQIDPMLRTPPRRRRRAIAAGATVALLVVGSGAAVATVNGFGGQTPDGRTYGEMPVGADVGLREPTQPDLVAVVGDHGESGYVQKRLLNAPMDKMPTSPDEALKEQAAKTDKPVVLDVYAADGVTKIDTFTLGRGFR